MIAMFIMFGTLTLRALRPLAMEQRELLVESDYQQIPLLRRGIGIGPRLVGFVVPRQFTNRPGRMSRAS